MVIYKAQPKTSTQTKKPNHNHTRKSNYIIIGKNSELKITEI